MVAAGVEGEVAGRRGGASVLGLRPDVALRELDRLWRERSADPTSHPLTADPAITRQPSQRGQLLAQGDAVQPVPRVLADELLAAPALVRVFDRHTRLEVVGQLLASRAPLTCTAPGRVPPAGK